MPSGIRTIHGTLCLIRNKMKYQNIILILSILLFASCKEITKDDINGNWIRYPSGYDGPTFREINFKEDQVELIEEDLFKEAGKYQIKNGRIKIQLDRDDMVIETKIQDMEFDTLLIFDNLTYSRNTVFELKQFEKYELIGIPTNKFLTKEKKGFSIIHFYKSNEDKIKIRIADRLADYQDIPLFLETSIGHSTSKVTIFIGKGITLKDLKKMYYCLASAGQFRILLGTKRKGISDMHIFKDEIEIWRDDLANHLGNWIAPPPLPPPPIDFTSKKEYLKNGGKEVEITNKNDLRKIELLAETERYVVSISSDLSIEDYFKLKEMILKKKKTNKEIITEIE